MKNYCVLSGIQSQILQDVLTEAVRKQSDYTVITADSFDENGKDSTLLVEDSQVDVMICELAKDVVPQQCQTIFQRNRNTLVVGLVDDARQLAIFADDADLELVTQLLKLKSNRSGEKD